MVSWNESAYRLGFPKWFGAAGGWTGSQRQRHQPDLSVVAWTGKGCICRRRYLEVEKHPKNAARPQQPQRHIAAKRGQIRAMAEGKLKELREELEKMKTQVRSRVEHPFALIKNLFKHRKVHYRSFAKNTAQLHTLGESELIAGPKGKGAIRTPANKSI